jgi:ferric-dicitrate binding protein FerR (iron transport regulator)
VLGTSFNVRAYRNEENHEVAVITGKVSVHADDKQSRLVVESGQKATLNIKTTYFAKETLGNTDLYTGWKEGRLIFDNAPVRTILQSLNRYYNTEIKARNSGLNDCLVTTTFDNLSLREILDLLSLTLNATYEKEGETYWLNGKGCAK